MYREKCAPLPPGFQSHIQRPPLLVFLAYSRLRVLKRKQGNYNQTQPQLINGLHWAPIRLQALCWVLHVAPPCFTRFTAMGSTISRALAHSVIRAIIVEVPGAKGNCRLPRGGKNLYEGSSRENSVRHWERKEWSLRITCAKPGDVREDMASLTNWKMVNLVKTHVWRKMGKRRA